MHKYNYVKSFTGDVLETTFGTITISEPVQWEKIMSEREEEEKTRKSKK